MSFLHILMLSALFWIEHVYTQEANCQFPTYPTGGICLDFNYNIIECTSKKYCTFIFSCPETFVQMYTECFATSAFCPNIADLTYGIDYNRDKITSKILLTRRNSSEEDTEEYTEEDTEEQPNEDNMPNARSRLPFYPNCSFQMIDFFSTGSKVRILDLQFNRMKSKVTLRTSMDIEKKFIQCYARDFDTLREIKIRRTYSTKRTREFLQIYVLNITQEPNIYFCDISAPMLYIRTRTDEVVAYGNSSWSRYISKISSVPTNIASFDYFRFELTKYCYSQQFNQCKLMKKQDNSIYYFLQDKHFREVGYIEEIIKEMMKNVNSDEDIPTIDYLRNIEYCSPENTSSTDGMVLTWNQTLVNTATTSLELCLDENGMQVTRRCEGDFFSGAFWEEPSADCSPTVYIPERTYRLHRLVAETSITEVFTNISAETNDFEDFTPVDVNLFSAGLSTMSMVRNTRTFKTDFFHSISNIMRVNYTVLRDSQEQLNSTDKILDSIDGFVENVAVEIADFSITIYPNVLTQISYPFISNVIGLAIYNNGNNDFTTYDIVSIHLDETFEELNLEKLELAVYVPSELIYNLTGDMTDEEKANFKIITTMFYNDGLFNEVEAVNRSAGSRIVNVNIPGFGDNFDIPIPLLFRPILNFTEPGCVYWDYGMQKHGQWSTTGGQYLGSFNNESLIQCSFTHLTHFALLVLSENIIRITDEDGVITIINPLDAHDLALTLITLIGCGLSLIGILGILISAILFKDWYKKRLNSIQLAIVMLLEIIILFVADLDVIVEGPACLAVGAILHYIVLSKFVWMLIIARIQYLKFVKIFESMQVKAHIIIHSLIGWLLPIIPVILALLIFPKNYEAGNLNFCYAKDYALYFFLILPAFIIILLNIAIFVSILISVSRSKAQDYGVNMQKVQIRLGIMLFFMLGITWIFGLIGELLPWSWFMLACLYIFCILGSLQGFVLFIFNVLLDKGTMDSWGDLFKITPKSKKPYEKSTRSEVLYTSDSENVTVSYFTKRD